MDADEVARLCASMSLAEKDNPASGLLVLEEPTGSRDIASMVFDTTEFWIQILNVPLICMNKEIGSYLDNLFEDLCDIDVGATGDCVGKYIRVRVRMNIVQPLRRVLKIDLDLGEEVILLLRYERLPEYYFHCGKLGHMHRECTAISKLTGHFDYSFGSKLRASSPTKSRPVRQKRTRSNRIWNNRRRQALSDRKTNKTVFRNQ
ncbi:hypothetical protein ACOSQ4_029019 [Xanthoceras sorbifolium]